MEHAFIEGDDSHRENKKFKQRLKYRLDKGYSYDEALRLATAREFIKNPSLRLVPNPHLAEFLPASHPQSDENRPLENAEKIANFRPDENQNDLGRKSSEDQNPRPTCIPRDPGADDIRLEVEKLKALGLMTEIPPWTNFVSSAEAVSSRTFPEADSSRLHVTNSVTSEMAPSVAPYWIISTLACFWLVYSMTTSLPGHWFGNLLIAIAFEFTPMLMLGARVERKHQRTVTFGAVGIFLLGLGLYLAPSAQMLWNESSAYAKASEGYESAVMEFEAKVLNSKALTLAAKADAERSSQGYEAAISSYGEKSWRTAVAKKQKVSDAAEWKRLSTASETFKAPAAPKISDRLIEASQAIAIRIGLFAVIFLSMFVTKRLQGLERA